VIFIHTGFIGAQDRRGKVEAADGILFLNEFNSIPPDVQVNLLRLIERSVFTRVGDIVEHKANVRIIAAGNKSFKQSAENGELRLDLYERFVKTIYIPTLKERIEDDEKSKKHVIREQLVRECLNERAQNSDDHIREDDYALQTAYDTAAKRAIRRALNKAGGNNDKAFGLLGISRTTYYDLKKKLGI
jgi:transcriptional regulator with PAS, ATPase and Fis domain